MHRRTFLLSVLAAPLGFAAARGQDRDFGSAEIERGLDGRLGVCAIDTATGEEQAHRGDERFPMCSTFKVMLAAAVLRRSETDAGLLDHRIGYAADDLVTYSPITEAQVETGMTVSELCRAALQYSDNTAANLLLRVIGGENGPAELTAYARSIGDATFRLDRFETALNSAIPGDERDTTTPRSMARALRRLLLGDALATGSRDRLRDWMLGNTTGDTRIRAGVPAGWRVADKTGTGDYGTANDVGVIYPPDDRPPIVLAVFTTRPSPDAQPRSDVISAATRIAKPM